MINAPNDNEPQARMTAKSDATKKSPPTDSSTRRVTIVAGHKMHEDRPTSIPVRRYHHRRKLIGRRVGTARIRDAEIVAVQHAVTPRRMRRSRKPAVCTEDIDAEISRRRCPVRMAMKLGHTLRIRFGSRRSPGRQPNRNSRFARSVQHHPNTDART